MRSGTASKLNTTTKPAKKSFLRRFRKPSTATDPIIASNIVELTSDNFAVELAGRTTIIDFWAPWCGPCRALHPVYAALASQHLNDALRFARLNVDDFPDVASSMDIMSIPTIVVIDGNGKVVNRVVAPDRTQLTAMVKQASNNEAQ